MIPCRLTSDPTNKDYRGWPNHTCTRCGKSWHMSGLPKEWKGDPVYCREWPDWWEIGYWLVLGLAAIGVTRSRYLWFKVRLGFPPQCGCGQRQDKANALGHEFALFLSRLFGRLRSYLRAEDRDLTRSRDAQLDAATGQDGQDLNDHLAVINDDALTDLSTKD